jgi:hypothetical protein
MKLLLDAPVTWLSVVGSNILPPRDLDVRKWWLPKDLKSGEVYRATHLF